MFNKNEILKTLISEYGVKTTKYVQEMLKDLFLVLSKRCYKRSLMNIQGMKDMITKTKQQSILEMDTEIKLFDMILEMLHLVFQEIEMEVLNLRLFKIMKI